MSAQLMDSLRRALGARWVRQLEPGAEVPASEVSKGIFRRGRTHLLRIDVPAANPARQLVCALDREPTTDDTLLAGAVARALGPPLRDRPERGSAALTRLAGALAAPAETRPQAILAVALAVASAPAGGIARADEREAIWVEGVGRTVLRRVARHAAEGNTGTVEVGERRFLLMPLRLGTGMVAGLALENASPSAELDVLAAAAGSALDRRAPRQQSDKARSDVQTIVGALPLPALAVDGEGNLVALSRAAEALFKLSADFDVGLPAAGKFGSPSIEAAAQGQTGQGTVTVGDRTVEPVVVPMPSGGRAVVLLDRTQEERLEKVQEDLVASVAHELRTPVAAVQGLVQLLRLRAGKLDADTLAGLLDDGEREIARLERLVEDLLLAARISTGGIAAVRSDIDLSPIADEVVQRAGQRYPSHAFRVDGEAGANADPALVRHALWHLVDNAAKYGAADGTVTVEIQDDGDGPEVLVHDEGEGIYSGDIPQLFRRFRQIDASSTRTVGGAGLGLFLVKEVVEAQGGKVSVKSRLGKGSTFGFRLLPAQDD